VDEKADQLNMTILNIPENCRTEDVLAWDLTSAEGFRLTRSSKFELGAQGVALAKLSGLESQNLVLKCEFKEPRTSDEFEATVLGTPFGLSLIRHAKAVFFDHGKDLASEDLEKNLNAFYRDRRGLLGKGQNCALVCVDPAFQVPRRLLDEVRTGDRPFPIEPSGFLKVLREMTALLGFKSFLSSATESSLNSFIYECFVNTQEHGISATLPIGRRSVRALVVEKVVVDKGGLAKNLSDDLRGYIERSAEAAGGNLGLGVVCLTVSDQGEGIQSTLPANSETESDVERFERAFRPGQSRKTQGTIKRGMGLDQVLSAAHKMRARISIHSADLTYVQDFSFEDQKYPSIDIAAICKATSPSRCGTSISIWVPEYEQDLDQPDLFDRKSLPQSS
jgi:hypothetical protein